jgi:hypothetical protein
MERENNKGGGLIQGLLGLVFVFLLFGIFTMVFRELKRGSILMWIYVIVVTIYVSIYGLC